jgi:ATP-dependent RNA circularization protein (DNA/RNA ligase family)
MINHLTPERVIECECYRFRRDAMRYRKHCVISPTDMIYVTQGLPERERGMMAILLGATFRKDQ